MNPQVSGSGYGHVCEAVTLTSMRCVTFSFASGEWHCTGTGAVTEPIHGIKVQSQVIEIQCCGIREGGEFVVPMSRETGNRAGGQGGSEPGTRRMAGVREASLSVPMCRHGTGDPPCSSLWPSGPPCSSSCGAREVSAQLLRLWALVAEAPLTALTSGIRVQGS